LLPIGHALKRPSETFFVHQSLQKRTASDVDPVRQEGEPSHRLEQTLDGSKNVLEQGKRGFWQQSAGI
jgi:hypothetical protein